MQFADEKKEAMHMPNANTKEVKRTAFLRGEMWYIIILAYQNLLSVLYMLRVLMKSGDSLISNEKIIHLFVKSSPSEIIEFFITNTDPNCVQFGWLSLFIFSYIRNIGARTAGTSSRPSRRTSPLPSSERLPRPSSVTTLLLFYDLNISWRRF